MRVILPALAALVAAGCGYVGEPLPPLANVPARVTDLTAVQRGSRIIVSFTVPKVTTEGNPLKPPPALDLRSSSASSSTADGWAASATPVAAGSVENGIAIYEIPTAPWVGKSVTLGVQVTGENRKSSGWSSLITLPVVAPPEKPTEVQVETTADGVRLTWRAAGDHFRIFRRTGSQSFSPVANVSRPPWSDAAAEFGKLFTYYVQTIVPIAGNREAESDPSDDVSITPVDRFPPAVPGGLQAVGTPTSVELTWEGNTESDLAGYRIYRALAGGPFEKIADTPTIPSYSDSHVERRKTYRYAITAVDQSGNESAQSTPVEVSLE